MNKIIVISVSTLLSLPCVAQSVQNISTLGCMLEPSKKVEISSPLASVIETIPVMRGEKVKKGQLLFKLRSGVESAGVDLAFAKSNFAERSALRNAELFGDDLLSNHERDEIETEKLIAAMELKVKQEELAMRTIYSPVDGVVIDRHNSIGEYVSTNPVLDVAVLDPLFVDVLMPFERFRDFTKGELLEVILPAPVNSQHRAKITIIDPIIDSASGTFRMRLELANKDYAIPAGVACQLQVITVI
ncbi:MAG: RND family efflux transporter MFP subunit [Shewanella psychromarinicola]|jgi:RND family efflux transporter MFP subunit|uniref:efflux RND transporter periplasmic adaptor subunit n=1 Tax=Shewanella psychromarinicola TaxID=2487742 RepID=UPI003EE8AD10